MRCVCGFGSAHTGLRRIEMGNTSSQPSGLAQGGLVAAASAPSLAKPKGLVATASDSDARQSRVSALGLVLQGCRFTCQLWGSSDLGVTGKLAITVAAGRGFAPTAATFCIVSYERSQIVTKVAQGATPLWSHSAQL